MMQFSAILRTIEFMFVAFVLSTNAQAATVTVDQPSKSAIALIFISGEISDGDDEKFSQIAAKLSEAMVVLKSAGGAIRPAMDIGRTIRLREYSTIVYRDDQCTSACALIWIAGQKRILFEGGKIGFHASYRDVNGAMLETGIGNALVGHYLSQLGFWQKTVMFATAAPPEKILWLNSNSAEISAIDFKILPNKNSAVNQSGRTASKNVIDPPTITVQQVVRPASQNSAGSINTRTDDGWKAATNYTIKNVNEFAQGLRQEGFQATVDKSDPDSPSIITGLGGNKFAIIFSSCVRLDCEYAEIVSYWKELDPKIAPKAARLWSEEENFAGAVYDDSERRIMVYHYVLLGKDGVTIRNMIDNLEYFERDYKDIGDRLLAER